MAQENFHFQVNLGGMLDILSNHLYKTTDVFLRELMQNGVDAVTRRKKLEPEFKDGRLHIALVPGKKLVFSDNGSGLTEGEIHEFLSVIGQSTKQQLEDGKLSEDYIGRFGIGLLSCFMVSDAIVVETRAIGEESARRWTGLPDGTYHIDAIQRKETGTSIILEAKAECEDHYTQEKIEELVKFYGIMLPVPVYLGNAVRPLNQLPGAVREMNRGQLLAVGEWLFDEEFLDAIPIHTKHLDGAAFILSYKTDVMIREGHRIFLKNMLLTEQGRPLLPEWGFFLKCFLNTDNLRPTASRENFYEDEALKEAQLEFTEAVKNYFRRLSMENPEALQSVVGVHFEAIKSMAVWDDEMFELFIDHLFFETSEGQMSGAQLCRAKAAMYVPEVARFKQLSSLFVAQNKLLVCTGYMNDDELVRKMVSLRGLDFEPVREENIEGILLELPQIPIEQWEQMMEQFHALVKRYNLGHRVYWVQMWRFMLFVDRKKALEYFEKFWKTGRDALSDCRACERCYGVQMYLAVGDYTKAEEHAKPIKSRHLRFCSDTPHKMYLAYIEEAMNRGDLKTAMPYARKLKAIGHRDRGGSLLHGSSAPVLCI